MIAVMLSLVRLPTFLEKCHKNRHRSPKLKVEIRARDVNLTVTGILDRTSVTRQTKNCMKKKMASKHELTK